MKRIITALIAVTMLLCFGALAETAQQDGSLIVTGSGTVYMEADRASASLGITLSGEDLGELQNQANEAVANICEALIAAGLEEDGISTNYIYISPRYDYSGEIEKMVGYSINNSLTISTQNIDQIGTYIDAAFAAGANTFDSINFTVQDDSEARQKALELAVQDAQQKAETIAAASGHQLGEIVGITEGNPIDYYSNGNVGGAVYSMEAMDAAVPGTTVRAAQVNVSADVQISYHLN